MAMNGPPIRRNPVAAIWVLGLLLAVILYVTGPEDVLRTVLDALGRVADFIDRAIADLIAQSYTAIRALAIALFVVFVALAVLAAQRGLRSRTALIIVPFFFLALVWPATYGERVSANRWFGAFVLAGVGAMVMTRRLTRGPERMPPADPRWRGPGVR
jgi:hypothetical protein